MFYAWSKPTTVETLVLRTKPQRLVTPLLGGLIGAVAGAHTLGTGVVFGRTESVGNVGGDSSTTLTGMRYFLAEEWQWPFLQVSNLNAPDGVPIAFTDSIPIWSLFAKTMGPLGLEPATWFGLWFLAVYVLQGLFAVEALRAWGVKHTSSLLAGSAVAVSMPFFIHRVFHPALTGHFIILAAWAVAGHLRTISPDKPRLGLQVAAVAAIVVSFLIHPYFIVMTSVVVIPVIADLVRTSRLSYVQGGAWFSGLVAAVGAIAYGGGYLTSGAGSAEGYGLFGMVAFGPLLPQRSDVFPGDENIIAVNGSLESYVWLGFGLLVGLLFVVGAAAMNRSRSWQIVQNHQLLALCMVCLYFYAITPVVHLYNNSSFSLLDNRLGPIPISISMVLVGLATLGASLYLLKAGSALIRRWPVIPVAAGLAVAVGFSATWMPTLLQSFTGQFRASGRLFWAIGYGLMIVTFVAIDRISRKELAIGVAVLIALIQLVDVEQNRINARSNFDSRPEQVADVTTFDSLIARHDRVTMPNNLACLGGHDIQRFQNVLTAASLDAKPIDNMDEPRIKTKNKVTCLDVQTVDLSPGMIGFYFGPVSLSDSSTGTSKPLESLCRQSTSITVCTQNWDEIDNDDTVKLAIPFE